MKHKTYRFMPLLLLIIILPVLSGCEVTQSLEEMPQDLEDVAKLKSPMEQVAALKEPMEQVAVLKEPMEQVAALKEPMEQVAKLKEPMAALGPMATITQPTTYVPMFGFLGIVLFLAIWGGIKMGRR